MKPENWKTIAIVSMVILFLVILSFSVLFFLGLQVMEEEDACSMACYDGGAVAFSYVDGVCYCTLQDGGTMIAESYSGG